MNKKEQKGLLATTWRSLKRNKIAFGSFCVLLILYGTALFADFISPYSFDDEERTLSYMPPVKIHLYHKDLGFRPHTFPYKYKLGEFKQRIWYEDTTTPYAIKLFKRGEAYKFCGLFPTSVRLFGVTEPARIYLFGADSRGRDLFSRILYGARVSLSIGLIGVFISFSLGLLFGGIAGYFGGRIDNILMRVVEMMMMIPGFYLLLALRSSFTYLNSVQMYIAIVFILSFIGWASLARVIRGMVLSLREREYVQAAKVLGVSNIKIILRHILPHTMAYTIVSICLSIPSYILGEAGLSILGLGIQDPWPSWGNLLSEALNIAHIQFHPWILIPGIFIFLTVMAYNLLGDGLRDALDPFARQEQLKV